MSTSEISSSVSCPNCSKAFPTARALAGHQTAHRKDKRLKRLLEEADFAAQIFEVDKDVVLCPEPIRWLPATADNYDPKTYEGYNFMPSTSDNVGNKTTKKNQKKRNLSESSEVINSENKQKKKKSYTKLGECSENNKGVTNLSDPLEKKGIDESTKLSEECTSEIKASDSENSKITEEQRKKYTKVTKLTPSPELTLATGAAPDVWVEECILYF